MSDLYDAVREIIEELDRDGEGFRSRKRDGHLDEGPYCGAER